MYLLVELCQHPGFLRALYFVLLCMDIIFIVVPIGLIIILLIDFSKAMIAGASDEAKKSTKLVGKRIISAMILFAIPWIVDVFTSSMGQMGFTTDFTNCINNARSGDFDYYEKKYKDYKDALNDARLADIASSSAVSKKTSNFYSTDSVKNSGSVINSGGMSIPVYYQGDYSDVSLANGSEKTVACCGCGFTSCAMIVSYLTDKKITPREFVDDWSRAYYVYGSGMSFGLPQAAASHYNLGTVEQTTDFDKAYQALKDGHPVMSSQGEGLFTSNAHLIVLRGVDRNGNILVNDPNKYNAVDKGYNNRSFTKSEINSSNTQYFIWPKK